MCSVGNKNMSTSAIILTAGKSSRMGKPKALLKWNGKTFLENIYQNLEKAGAKKIVIVTNKSIYSLIQPSHFPVLAINPNPEQGMLSSFRCGLRALESTAANVMLCLTDHPAVKAETYKILIENAQKNNIIIPKCNGRRGHPVIFGANFIPELLENDCPEGARTIVRAHPESVKEIYVDDSGILLDIDTPAEAKKAGVDIIL